VFHCSINNNNNLTMHGHLVFDSIVAQSSSNHQSAAIKSWAAFRMHAQVVTRRQSSRGEYLQQQFDIPICINKHVESTLFVWTEFIARLEEGEMKLSGPTVVQHLVLPELLKLGSRTAVDTTTAATNNIDNNTEFTGGVNSPDQQRKYLSPDPWISS
jgi:hypothetical protein